MQNLCILSFLVLFHEIFIIFLHRFILGEIIMPKAKTKPKKLSKAALWWKKHPEGLPLIIHDLRAVMR